MTIPAHFPLFKLVTDNFDRFHFKNPANGTYLSPGEIVNFGGANGIVASACAPGAEGTVLMPTGGFVFECEYTAFGSDTDQVAGKAAKLNPATGKVHHAGDTVTNAVTVILLPKIDRDYNAANSGLDEGDDKIVRVALWPGCADGAMTIRPFTGSTSLPSDPS